MIYVSTYEGTSHCRNCKQPGKALIYSQSPDERASGRMVELIVLCKDCGMTIADKLSRSAFVNINPSDVKGTVINKCPECECIYSTSFQSEGFYKVLCTKCGHKYDGSTLMEEI